MKQLASFAEVSQYLERFHDQARTKYSLDNMQALMAYLDNPQNKFKAVHIAGTSGKTSTAYFMAALLTKAGCRVGLTVSPHVVGLNERLQVNGTMLSETEFCRELSDFLALIENAPVRLSWFETMISFAYWYFAKEAMDYVVIEVGLGGLKDATNVISRSDKVCVITDIGLDHINVLGKTLDEIASQKIGIVRDQNQVFTYRQAEAVMEVFRNNTKRHKATLNIVDESVELKRHQLVAMPDYQKHNWLLACRVYEYLADRDKLRHLSTDELQQTQRLQIPGRMEWYLIGDKTIIMDGAHNTQKMQAFISSFQQLYPGEKPGVLLALKQGKEYEELAPLLKSLASRVIVTTFDGTQDLPLKSIEPTILAAAFRAEGIATKSVIDQSQALTELLGGPEKFCVITGSLYLLSQLRSYIVSVSSRSATGK